MTKNKKINYNKNYLFNINIRKYLVLHLPNLVQFIVYVVERVNSEKHHSVNCKWESLKLYMLCTYNWYPVGLYVI